MQPVGPVDELFDLAQADLAPPAGSAHLCVLHGGPARSQAGTTADHLHASRLEIDILDQGSSLKAKPKPPDVDAKLAGTESPRGWGIPLMERTVDEVGFAPGSEGRL